MAKKAKLSGIMEVGRKALKPGQPKRKWQGLTEALLANYKRPRGRPKGSGSRVTPEAAKDFERFKQELRKLGRIGKYIKKEVREKMVGIIIEWRAKKRIGVSDRESLKNYLRRSKRNSRQ